MSTVFHLSQWNNPRWRERHPARAESRARPEPESTLVGDEDIPRCARCTSTNLRPAGWFISKRSEEKHQDVQCRACGHYSRLTVGVVLPRKPARSAPEPAPVVLAEDQRPPCPYCGGQRIQRRDRLPTRHRHNHSGFKGVSKNGSGWCARFFNIQLGTFSTPERAARAYNEAARKHFGESASRGPSPAGRRRWYCVECDRRFVADDTVAFVDHRKVQHFADDDPHEEACFLFVLAQRSADFEGTRAVIEVSEEEKRILDILIQCGILDRGDVDTALIFRRTVADIFNKLVHDHQKRSEGLLDGPGDRRHALCPEGVARCPTP